MKNERGLLVGAIPPPHAGGLSGGGDFGLALRWRSVRREAGVCGLAVKRGHVAVGWTLWERGARRGQCIWVARKSGLHVHRLVNGERPGIWAIYARFRPRVNKVKTCKRWNHLCRNYLSRYTVGVSGVFCKQKLKRRKDLSKGGTPARANLKGPGAGGCPVDKSCRMEDRNARSPRAGELV
jgi:hypothetical protein